MNEGQRLRYDAFLTYRWDEEKAVAAIAEYLSGHGVSAFFGPMDIVAGHEVRLATRRGLENSACLVFVLGRSGLGVGMVQELSQARELGLPTIPVLLPGGDAGSLPDELQRLQLISLRSETDSFALDRLIDAIQAVRDARSTPADQSTPAEALLPPRPEPRDGARQETSVLPQAPGEERSEGPPAFGGETAHAAGAPTEAAADDDGLADLHFELLSRNTRSAILRANAFRLLTGRSKVHMEHLLVGLHDARESVASARLREAGIERERLAAILTEAGGVDVPGPTPYTPTASAELPPLSNHAAEALRWAARSAGERVVVSEEVLEGALRLGECRVIAHLATAPEGQALWDSMGLELPSAAPRPEPELAAEVTELSIRLGSAGDQPTAEDALGFGPYVDAVAEFLVSAETKPPLTLSIEGEWGSGKSSFMLQLEKALRDKSGEAGCLAVRFNSWRHDKEEALWAAFALHFLDEVARQLPWRRRWEGHLRLFLSRYSWREGWLDMARAAGAWLALAAATVAAPLLSLDWLRSKVPALSSLQLAVTGLTILGAYVAGVFSLVVKVKDLVGNPLKVDLKKYLRSPDYEGRVSFVERFHEDFARIVSAYAGGRKVYVFIDDLDRCEVPKAADLMQAINLLVADDPHLVFVIGMDREKVAAGLAVKHEKIVPYLALAERSSRTAGEDGGGKASVEEETRRRGLEFGYAFIEKFIQVPFLVPTPTPADLDHLLVTMAGSAGGTERRRRAAAPGARSERAPAAGLAQEAETAAPRSPGLPPGPRPGGSETVPEAVRQERARRVQLGFREDSEEIRRVALLVAPALDSNPRRIKQFLNVFRLRAFIANSTGLLDERGGRPPLSLEGLGLFVALGLAWPRLMADVAEDHGLLKRLAEAASDETKKAELQAGDLRWLDRSRLCALLASTGSASGGPLLATLDVEMLLRVSPRLETLAPAVAGEDTSPDEPRLRSADRSAFYRKM